METQHARNISNDYTENLATASARLNSNSLENPSAVSWGAIFAGAAAAAALSLILLLLGTGLGLASVSPWSHEGISSTTFSVSTIVWITLTSLLASAIGGYIAGRLRTRWVATHADEIYFRDTAHGFLAWAVATLITASVLTSVISSIVSTGAQAGAALAGGVATATTATAAVASATTNQTSKLDPEQKAIPYFLDTLFRKEIAPVANGNAMPNVDAKPGDTPRVETPRVDSPQPGTVGSKAEVARIYANAIANGSLPAEDAQYAAQVVSQSTGLTQQEAEKRVADTFKALQTKIRDAETAARNAADQARKASAYGSLWLFISLLVGAFIASLTAIYGGRQRDL